MTPLANQFLDELSEVKVNQIKLRTSVRGIDFDTEKHVTIPAGTYEVVDDSDALTTLISDTKGNLFYLTQ